MASHFSPNRDSVAYFKTPPILILSHGFKPHLDDLSRAIEPAFRTGQICRDVKNAVLYLHSIYPPTTEGVVFDAREPRIIILDNTFGPEEWEIIRDAIPREYWCDGKGFAWLTPAGMEKGMDIKQEEEVERIKACVGINRVVLEKIGKGELLLDDQTSGHELGTESKEGLCFWF